MLGGVLTLRGGETTNSSSNNWNNLIIILPLHLPIGNNFDYYVHNYKIGLTLDLNGTKIHGFEKKLGLELGLTSNIANSYPHVICNLFLWNNDTH
jgi:hypothetical protein